MNANKNKHESSNNRRILKQTMLALHSLPRKHWKYTLHSKTLFTLLSIYYYYHFIIIYLLLLLFIYYYYIYLILLLLFIYYYPFIVYPIIIQGCNQNFVKGVSLAT